MEVSVAAIKADYSRYLQELHALEASPYETDRMVGLRRRWVDHFVSRLRTQDGAARHEAAAAAMLLLLNLGRFTQDWSTYAPETFRIAKEALRSEPVGAGASEACLWIEDTARESLRYVEAEELLAAYAKLAQERPLRARALLSLARVQYEHGTLDDAAVTLDEMTEHFPESDEARVAKGLLNEIRLLQVGAILPPLHDVSGLDGSVARLSAARGRWTWIEFFSLACGACNLDYDVMRDLNEWLRNRGVVVCSIELESADSERGDRAPGARGTLVRQDDPVVTQFNVYAVPRNFILDPQGRLVRKDVPAGEARATWQALLEDDGPPGTR